MLLGDGRIDSFLVSAAVIIGPWLYFALPKSLPKSAKTSRPETQSNPGPGAFVAQNQQSQLDWRRRARLVNVFVVALNAALVLYSLFLWSPQNVYTTLHAPLGTTGDDLRATIQRLTAEGGLRGFIPEDLNLVLTRLNERNLRAMYSKYGHDALACLHCITLDDFALYYLPGPLLAYILEAFVVGFMTTRASGSARWRKWGIGALVTTVAIEIGITFLLYVDAQTVISYEPMWHDRRWLGRHIFFLILPPILYFLPTSPLQDTPLSLLPQITALLEMTITRIHLLKYVRGSSSRSSTLCQNSNSWWRREHLEGQWAREDEGLKEVAEKLGLGYGGEDESSEKLGKLRENARNAVQALKTGFMPSEHLNQ